jgi:dihydrofolate reductase
MSLDGFVAGPNHEMDWMTGISFPMGLIDEYVATTGAVLGGRSGWDGVTGDRRPYGGAWDGPIFVLTHHPEDARPTEGVTFLNCGVAEALRIGLEAAGGKNLEVFSPTIGRQLLDLGLIDEIDLLTAPILLGHGIRLYDNPGGEPIRLHRVGSRDPISGRQRPLPTGFDRERVAAADRWPSAQLTADLPEGSSRPRTYRRRACSRFDWWGPASQSASGPRRASTGSTPRRSASM